MKKIRSATFTILTSAILSAYNSPAYAQSATKPTTTTTTPKPPTAPTATTTTTPPSSTTATTAPTTTTTTAQSKADTPAPIKSVTITGSRIIGARMQEALPVSIIDEAQIAAVGSVSGDDLFRSLPQAGDVNFQESRTTGNLNDARGDNASINLRSIGTGNTLVLVNGRRLILTPGTQTENFVPVQTANTNSLPVGSISRIEVLRDGAAALYGSDAVAGVVNVITDTKFEGVKLQTRYGKADGTEEKTASIKAGMRTKAGGNVQMFASYTNRTPMMASERAFSASENHMPAMAGTSWADDTSFDNRSTSSPWGAFTAINAAGAPVLVRQGTTALTTTGAFHIEPTSNTAAGCSSAPIAGNLCIRSGGITGTANRPLRYDENPDRSIRGGLDRLNSFASFLQPLGEHELFGEANFYQAKLEGMREQSAPLSSAVITVPATNYWNPFGPSTSPNRLPNLTLGVPAGGLPIRITNYRPVDAGPRNFVVTDNMARGLLGLRGDLGDFKWESAVSYARAKTDDNTRNAISNTRFQQQLALSTPDAYNPFNGGTQDNYSVGDGTPNASTSIKPFLVDVHRISTTSLTTWDMRLSTPKILQLKSGNVGLAAGVEWRRETYGDDRDARIDGTIKYVDSVSGTVYGTDIMGASAAPDVSASRNVLGAYLELEVPLIGKSMNIPGVRSLDLQVAGRIENYSDFGSVSKPKLAALWEVTPGIKVRGSWSKSYRAPNLPQFYSDGTSVTNTRTDWAGCRINATTCSGISTIEVRAGNNQLQPESSESTSAGLALQPFNWLSMTVDSWQIKSNGVIGIMGGQNQILYDYLQRLEGASNPNVVRLAPVGSQMIGTIDRINDDYFNLGPRTMRGWDANLTTDSGKTAQGRFRFALSVAKLLKFNQSASAIQQKLIDANNAGKFGTGIVIAQAGDQIGQGANPQWRWSGNLTWDQGSLSAGLNVSSVGSYFDTGTAVINGAYYKVPRWTTASAYTKLRMPKNDGLFGKTELRVGVRNLFNKAPAITSSNYGFNGALHDATGRFVYVELSKEL